MEDLERVRHLFEDLDTKKDLIQLLGLAERAEGVRIFIGSENKLFSLSGSALIVSPVRGHRAEDRGRARRDRPDAAQLCAHHPHGGLHGKAARAPCPLIFAGRRSISPLEIVQRRHSSKSGDARGQDRSAKTADDGSRPSLPTPTRQSADRPTRRRKPSAELEALIAENADMRDRLLAHHGRHGEFAPPHRAGEGGHVRVTPSPISPATCSPSATISAAPSSMCRRRPRPRIRR